MLDRVLNSPDTLRVALVLVPALAFVWIVMTVIALHRRGVYFWSLGSTWSGVVACPIALVIVSLSGWSQLHDPNAAPFQSPTMGGSHTVRRRGGLPSYITSTRPNHWCWPSARASCNSSPSSE